MELNHGSVPGKKYGILQRSHILTFSLAVLTSTLVLFQPSILNLFIPQVDHLTHIRWAYQFSQAIEEGVLYPRWGSAAHGGLGEPVFLYYQPLFYYTVASFNFLVSDIDLAIRLTLLFSNFLLGVAAFYILREFLPRPYAWLGMILVQSTPLLFFMEAYGGALPWVFASPFIILFARESADKNPNPILLAIWLGFLIMSHILSAFMVLISIGVCRLFFMVQHFSSEKARFVQWVFGVCIGLLLSSVYLYPALTLQSLISPEAWTNNPYIDWRRAFAFPLFGYFEYGLRWFALQWPFPILALTTALAALWLSNKDKSDLTQISRQFALFALVAILLSSELSYPLYLISGALQTLQQPYRFIAPASLFASFALILFLPSLLRIRKLQWSDLLGLACLGLSFMLVVILQVGVDKEGVTPSKSIELMEDKFGQHEYVIATRGSDWSLYLERGGWEGECVLHKMSCTHEQRATHGWSASVSTPSHTFVKLPRFFFPAWNVTVNGKGVLVEPDVDTGLILVGLPAGQHSIQVTWKALPAERIGLGLSLIGFLLILLLAFKRKNIFPITKDRL